MKRFHMLAVAGVIAAVGGTAMASNGSLTQFMPKVMPVLVHVNSHGKVTGVSPSTHLSPSLSRLLSEALDGWINRPGMTNGQPVDMAMIVNVALKAEPRVDGDYDMHFAYVSSSPSPFHSAHWASINGNELALVDNNGGRYDEIRNVMTRNEISPGIRFENERAQSGRVQGSFQGVSHNAPRQSAAASPSSRDH